MKTVYSDIILIIAILVLFWIGAVSYNIFIHVYTISSILSEYTIELTQ